MYKISLQTYIPTLILKCEPKSGLSGRRQVVHPRPQTPQGESVAKPETPLLIILSIACKWGPWQHVQSVIRKAKSVDVTPTFASSVQILLFLWHRLAVTLSTTFITSGNVKRYVLGLHSNTTHGQYHSCIEQSLPWHSTGVASLKLKFRNG